MQGGALTNVLTNSQFLFVGGSITARSGQEANTGVGWSPLYPTAAALQAVHVPYGGSRHFVLDIPEGRDGDTLLVLQMCAAPTAKQPVPGHTCHAKSR